MGRSIERLCQKVLDVRHPGKQAQEVITNLCPELYSKETTEMELLSRWLYDCFSQVNLEGHQMKNGKVRTPLNRMLEELAYRLLFRWSQNGFVNDCLESCEVAKRLVKTSDQATSILSKIEKKKEFLAFSKQLEGSLLEIQPIRIKTFLLGETPRLLNGQAGSSVRSLFYPENEAKTNSIKFPLPADLRIRLQEEKRAIQALDNRELGLRIMHLVKDNDLSRYDPAYPVYGVKSIYVLIPWAIDRLCNASFELDCELPNQFDLLNKEMKYALGRLDIVLSRYHRLTTEKDHSTSMSF